MYIAEIAVSKLSFSKDMLYSYEVPESFQNDIKIGCRVIVPFGKGSAKRLGIVMAISRVGENKVDIPLKKIYAVLKQSFSIPPHMIDFIKWLSSRYFCSYFDAAKFVLPHGLSGGLGGIRYKINKKVYEFESTFKNDEKAFLDVLNRFPKGIFKLKDILGVKIKNYNKILNNFISMGFIDEEFVERKERIDKYFKINESFLGGDFPLTEKQKKVCDYLRKNKIATIKEICYFTGVSSFVVKNLFAKGILCTTEKIFDTLPEDNTFSACRENKNFKLAPYQMKAYNKAKEIYLENKFDTALLYGITGSGKTEVLLNLVDLVLSFGKSIIFMMPEIALTSQFIDVFKSRYPGNVAVIHSALSDKERFRNWKLINEGKCKVVLGTRSAVFAPVKNLGLIVIDEEHESTYKSESSPRFNAKEVAKYRCKLSDALMILSSATPSVESYYNAKIGKYKLITMNERYGDAHLPKMNVIDMNASLLSEKSPEFSKELEEALKNNFKNKKQSIIFINRRGYNTLAKCGLCGEVFSCPNCSISLNYHKSNGKLMCHYCGFSKDFSDLCNKCQKRSVKFLGFGTQKIEEVLHKIIPEAKVLRMDTDSKNIKKFENNPLKDFANGKYDILVGTQMVSKGFNFSRVTLVGVLSVDQYLYSSDFKSYERTYSLLTQVAGRSGRDKFPGVAIIQTFNPECEIFEFVRSQNYEEFFNHEINIRKAMLYPPFSDICVIGFTSENEKRAYNASLDFFKNIKDLAKCEYSDIPLRIFAPFEAALKKVSGKYRYRILIKCKNNYRFRNLVANTLKIFSENSVYKDVPLFVDINPDMIL